MTSARSRTRRPTLIGLTIAALAASGVTPAVATATHNGFARISEAVAGADKTVSAIRSAGASGSLAGLLETAMNSDGGASDQTISRVAAASLSSAHASLAQPIGELHAAVQQATSMVEEALEGVKPRVRQQVLRAVTGPGTTGHRAAVARTEGEDMPTIRAAAVVIAEALDRNLPALQAMGGSSDGRAADGCDLVAQLPALCVGDDGPNTYTEDAALLIDLGGDDRYENSAGGAAALTGGLPVSVNVDIGGNDTYHNEIREDQMLAAQGASFYGVGVLVDAAGNDSYLRRYSPRPSGTPGGLLAMAQGSSAAGVSILADLGGDDRYTVLPGNDLIAYYQGAGDGYGSTGVLFDAAGNDAYRLDGGTIEPAEDGTFTSATRQVYGQGFGLFGVGVLLDPRGSDSFTATGSIQGPDGFDSYEDYDEVIDAPGQSVGAQGIGELGGTGLLLTGDGPTSYEASASSSGPAWEFVFGQGHSDNAGMAVLDDLGGNDTYTLSAEMEAEDSAAGGLGCDCDAIEAAVDTSQAGNPINLSGQGNSGAYFFGNASALGLLSDHGGNDRYLVKERSEALATASASGGVGARATATAFAAGPLWVQGTAHTVGVGALVDAAGDDFYDVELLQVANAEAVATDGGDAVSFADAMQDEEGAIDPPIVLAQGASGFDPTGAALLDLEGSDSYRVVTRSVAHAVPTPENALEQRTDGSVQGSGPNAFFVDQDGGDLDSFVAEPNYETTCEGNRGEPTRWQECPDIRQNWIASTQGMRPLGVGLLDSAPAKATPAISITEVKPHASGAALVVSGTLAGPGGAPLTERFIDVRLSQTVAWEGAGSQGGQASRVMHLSASHAFTGPDGTWSAVIPLPDEGVPSGTVAWAGFSGDAGLRADTAEQPL